MMIKKGKKSLSGLKMHHERFQNETSNGVTDTTNVSDMPLEALRGSPYASGASVGKGANRDQELGTFFKDKPHITLPPPPTSSETICIKKFVNTDGR